MNNGNQNDSLFYNEAVQLGRILQVHSLTCCVAESCTGGMIGSAITAVEGSSAWFRGGIIAYSNDIKIHLCGVPADILAEKGAVSAETVIGMASGAARVCAADCAVAVSGIAGPGGGSSLKPVGLVYIGIFCRGRTASFCHLFTGDRHAVRQATTAAALHYLIEALH